MTSEPAYLLDSSVLIALLTQDHFDHERTINWFQSHKQRIAVCPITEGALVRLTIRTLGASGADLALSALRQLAKHPRFEFVACDLSFSQLTSQGMLGDRQVNDRYLVELAKFHGYSLATLDRGQAAMDPDIAELV